MRTAESYSPTEEVAHSFTAALGVVATLMGIPWLVFRASEIGGAWRVIGALAFGFGALMMFATSTLYHAARRPRTKGSPVISSQYICGACLTIDAIDPRFSTTLFVTSIIFSVNP
jgi:channel protein (hemolysin III family)